MLEAVELITDLEGEVRRAVNDVEGLGEMATMNGELEERALDVQA